MHMHGICRAVEGDCCFVLFLDRGCAVSARIAGPSGGMDKDGADCPNGGVEMPPDRLLIHHTLLGQWEVL